MTSISSLRPDQRFQTARNVADSLNSPFDQIEAHIKIAKDDPQHDFSWAKRSALKNSGTGFALVHQRELLRTIAAAEAYFNFAAAKATADSIDDPITRELGYIDIIRAKPETDIAAKIIVAEAIKDPLRKDCALCHIAIGVAKIDISAARTIATSIQNDFHREKA